MQGLSFPRSAWGCRPGRSASAFVPAQKRRRASKTAFPRRAWERGEARLTQVNRCISWIFMGLREPSAIHESSFGESPRPHRVPWLRFAARTELASFCRAVTDYRGFVSLRRRARLPRAGRIARVANGRIRIARDQADRDAPGDIIVLARGPFPRFSGSEE